MDPSAHRLKLLITGVSGLLGNNLAWHFARTSDVLGLYNGHPVVIPGIRTERCDLLDEKACDRMIEGFRPDVVIHCASLANVDQCESDPELSERLNVTCTRRIAAGLEGSGTHLIYISTDSVYEGTRGLYSEEDAPRPLNVYGRTKWEGEKPVLSRTGGLVLRTNLFGWNIQDKQSLGEWILGELQAGRPISGFRDAIFSTVYTMELARIIDVAIRQKLTGLYNCGSSDSCSKYEFALKIADRFGFDRSIVRPISIDDFQFRARRGKNLSLATAKLEAALGYRLPTIDRSVDEFYRDWRCRVPEVIRENRMGRTVSLPFIPYGRQWIDESDIQAVAEVLRSERITQGPKVEEFERALAEYCGARYAVAVNSGTSALHIACLAAGVSPGSEVITSPVTFVASANCAAYCGARPVFADIDARTFNLSPEEIAKRISAKTAAVIPVHMAGQSCDMESIAKLVEESARGGKITIIEDACHALGSMYKGRRVGACTHSDMAVTSFHPVKHITTGEGGAVLTNDKALYRRLQLFRSHGITNVEEEFTDRNRAFAVGTPGDGLLNPWYYEQLTLGYNYRMTDIQSALGLSQLRRIEEIRARRRAIVERYNEAFSGVPHMETPHESEVGNSNFHLYIALFDFDGIGLSRAAFMTALRSAGMQTQVHYIPVYLQPYYRNLHGTKAGDCPKAEAYYRRCLSLPLFPAMRDEEVEHVIRHVKDLCGTFRNRGVYRG
jgi:UDP-4-amino-4,6-dideoxy-N-acetyl-beta-L-altrosamine transaminase/dTDP-4-dehydrorhamnose reductase